MQALIESEKVPDYPGARSGPNFRFIPRARSTKLVIYFSGTGKDNGKFDFWNSGREIRENLLFVSDGRNHWYQDGVPGLGETVDETVRTIVAWCRFLEVKEVITIGASMGGYGAILFAHKLGGRAFSFGNDTILKLPMSRSKQLMPRDAETPVNDLAPLIEETATPVQIYAGEMDPMDMVGAQRIAHLPSVSIVTLRGVTHWCARYLNEAIGLVDLLTRYVRGRAIPKLDEAGNYIESPEFVDLMYRANQAFQAREFETSLDLCEQATTISPLNEAALHLKGLALIKLRRPKEALLPMSIVAAAVPHFEDGQVNFAILMRLLGDLPKAIHLSNRVLKQWPGCDKAHHNLALAYLAAGDKRKAYTHAVEASKLLPKSTQYAKLQEKLKPLFPRLAARPGK